MQLASTPRPSPRRPKRPFSALSTPPSSLPSSPSSSDDDRPHKKLAFSLNRLSLTSTPVPDPPRDTEMRQRKSYEKDAFTTVIESLSTSDSEAPEPAEADTGEAPFPRAENHVSIISEIERRLTQFPTKVLVPGVETKERVQEGALVLYRSPESMGLPKSERHTAEELKAATRKRIMERRRGRKGVSDERDGYEADAEDWEDGPVRKQGVMNGGLATNGVHREEAMRGEDIEDEEYGDMMDLD